MTVFSKRFSVQLEHKSSNSSDPNYWLSISANLCTNSINSQCTGPDITFVSTYCKCCFISFFWEKIAQTNDLTTAGKGYKPVSKDLGSIVRVITQKLRKIWNGVKQQ